MAIQYASQGQFAQDYAKGYGLMDNLFTQARQKQLQSSLAQVYMDPKLGTVDKLHKASGLMAMYGDPGKALMLDASILKSEQGANKQATPHWVQTKNAQGNWVWANANAYESGSLRSDNPEIGNVNPQRGELTAAQFLDAYTKLPPQERGSLVAAYPSFRDLVIPRAPVTPEPEVDTAQDPGMPITGWGAGTVPSFNTQQSFNQNYQPVGRKKQTVYIGGKKKTIPAPKVINTKLGNVKVTE